MPRQLYIGWLQILHSTTSSVQLVQASTIPGRKGRFVDVVVDGGFDEGAEVLFEPDTGAVASLCLRLVQMEGSWSHFKTTATVA